MSNPRGRATGSVIVMEMDGMTLLLGNDFLKQFGRLEIDYRNQSPMITLGDLSLNNIHVDDGKNAPVGGQLPVFTLTARMIAAQTSAAVTILPLKKTTGHWLMEPSAHLMATKALSAGISLYPEGTQPCVLG